MAEITKVGIIACSGEEIPGGSIVRQATRRVLELLRPQSTVTLCLPLFLAGEEQERRFARQHPTIAVDGCDKLCAKRGTEKYSGAVAASVVASDVLGDRLAKCHCSLRDFDKNDEEAVWLLAERIAAQVDAISATAPQSEPSSDSTAASCACSCGKPNPDGSLCIQGKTIAVNGLPLIFDHLYKHGLTPGDGSAEELLQTVRIYQEISPAEECHYRVALTAAYGEYHQRRTKSAAGSK